MKILNAFFIGFLFVLAVIFIFFVGLKISYFDYYGITEYFNVIFADSLPWLAVLAISLLFGYLILYSAFRRFVRVIYVLVLLICTVSLHAEIGRKIGEFIFMSEPMNVKISENLGLIINGRIIYVGRKTIYFLRSDTGKVINIKKNFE